MTLFSKPSFSLLLIFNNLNAQSVTETINYNQHLNASVNDFQNHFYKRFSTIGYTASPSNRITGGILTTADRKNYGCLQD